MAPRSLRLAFLDPACCLWRMAPQSPGPASLHPACCLWRRAPPSTLCHMLAPSPRSMFLRPASSVHFVDEHLLSCPCSRTSWYLLVVKQHRPAFHTLLDLGSVQIWAMESHS